MSDYLPKFAVAYFAAVLASSPTAARADTPINAVPSGWLIQRYVGGTIIIFNAGTTCPQGQMFYPGSSSEEAAELWSLIISAKMANRMVLIWYQATGGSCAITSFGLAPN